MRTAPPVFSRESLVLAIMAYNQTGLSVLTSLAIVTAFMSGLGFVAGFDDPSLATYLAGAVFGFGVWLIAHGFWHGAWLLPEYITRNYIPAYALVAVLGFGAYGTVSVIGNLKFNAGALSGGVAVEERIDRLANATQTIITHVGQIGPIEAELTERATQAARFAAAEAAGEGPTGVGGKGPVYFGFTAASDAYADARSLLAGRVARFAALRDRANDTIAKLRTAKSDPKLSAGERKGALKSLEGEALALMREALALDPAGSISAAAELVGKGVPTPSRTSSSSAARIAEINRDMKAYAAALSTKIKQIKAGAPVLPDLSSQTQEEHLLANALRMPGLSLAALLFDACGWIIIGFRFAAYRSLRTRDERAQALDYDAYVTPADFKRVLDMAEEAREAQKKLLSPPKPRGRPRGSKNAAGGEDNGESGDA